MTSFEISHRVAQRIGALNRQGVPCFLGSTPAHGPDDLRDADIAIVGVPFVSPLIGYENDIAPRKVRVARSRPGQRPRDTCSMTGRDVA